MTSADTSAAPFEPSLAAERSSFSVRRWLPPFAVVLALLSALLTAALAATRGNQIRAADLLGLNRNTLRKKIRDLDIQVYRSGG